MTPTEKARTAREHLVKWIDFYLMAFPNEAGSQEQLAKKLGISAAAISMWRKKGSTRYPNVKNLIKLHALITEVYSGVNVDSLLFHDPPRLPDRR